MNLRESVGLACVSDALQWSAHCAGDVDRLTALAWASRASNLGAMLYRIVVAQETALIPLARQLLANRLRRDMRLEPEQRAIVARHALRELLEHRCRVCAGIGTQRDDAGVIDECRWCEGSGEHRWSDGERRHALAEVPDYERALSVAQGRLGQAILEVNRALAAALAE